MSCISHTMDIGVDKILIDTTIYGRWGKDTLVLEFLNVSQSYPRLVRFQPITFLLHDIVLSRFPLIGRLHSNINAHSVHKLTSTRSGREVEILNIRDISFQVFLTTNKVSFYSGQFSKTVLPLTFTSFCSLRILSFTCLNTTLSSAGGAAGIASGEGIVGYPDAVAGNPASAWGGDSKE